MAFARCISELRGRLEHPAAGGHRIGKDVISGGCRATDEVHEEEPRAFLDADPSRRETAVPQDLHDGRTGILVLLPQPDVVGKAHHLSRSRLLERGTDECGLAPCRQHHREHTLARAPANAGEIAHRRAGLNEYGIDIVLDHEPACLLHARPALVIGDRDDARSHRPERPDRLGDWSIRIPLCGFLTGACRGSARTLRGRATGARSGARHCGRSNHAGRAGDEMSSVHGITDAEANGRFGIQGRGLRIGGVL
jgi:hypothetical protein